MSTDLNKNGAGAQKVFFKLSTPEAHKHADLVQILAEATKKQMLLASSSAYFFGTPVEHLYSTQHDVKSR